MFFHLWTKSRILCSIVVKNDVRRCGTFCACAVLPGKFERFYLATVYVAHHTARCKRMPSKKGNVRVVSSLRKLWLFLSPPRGSTEIFASNSEKSGSGHGSHVAASAMGGCGHGSHMTNLPILKQENCMSLKAGHDNRVSYAFLHRFWWNPASSVVFCVGGGFEKSRS